MPLAKKPGLQLHVPESAALTLLLGQAVHVDAPAGLNEPARQAVHDCRKRQRGGARLAGLECAKKCEKRVCVPVQDEPNWLKVPAAHSVWIG